MYANIALNLPLAQTFSYHVPSALEDILKPGHMVEAPFKTGVQAGIVLEISDSTDIEQAKTLTGLLHPEPVLTAHQIAWAQWIATTYLSPIGMCIWSLLPRGMEIQRDVLVRLTTPIQAAKSSDQALIDLLAKRGPLRGHQLDLAMAGQHWRAAVDRLVQEGIVEKTSILTTPRAKPKQIHLAALDISPAQIDRALQSLSRPSKAADALEFIANSAAPVSTDEIQRATAATKQHLEQIEQAGWASAKAGDEWRSLLPSAALHTVLSDLRKTSTAERVLRVLSRERGPMELGRLYAEADAELTDLKRLEKYGYIRLEDREVWRDSLASREFVLTDAPPLTPEQAVAWQALAQAFETREAKTFLLHGVTGSGKTELYLRAIEAALSQGRDAIYLVPEIALTAQTVRRVGARFPGQLAVVHSKLSQNELYDTWRRARQGDFHIVVGARSALFTPLPNIGVIILDEEHDSSYKQSSEQTPPQYHARAAAEQLALLHGAVVILGSATPAIESLHRAERGAITLLTLPRRVLAHRVQVHEQEERTGVISQFTQPAAPDAFTAELPPVEVVDMRAELRAGNTNMFSRALYDALADVFARREQALLLMNRRGAASYVFCRDCGTAALCPRCGLPLTHHREGELLRCHHCGHHEPVPTQCPHCGSKRIRYFGAGTQQVEQTVKTHFPNARVLRWDADSATRPGDHEAILQHFIDRYADVIVGTQMIAKGLDLPLVTLVGVISADVSLNLPDFRAAERTFQLLTQMAGRAGRGLLGGKVILQTYQPEHYAIQAAALHDAQGFYEREIAYRRDLGYPPFRRLVRVVISHGQEAFVRAEAERAARLLRQRLDENEMQATEITGPAPCFFSRINHDYRWQIILRGPDPSLAFRGMTLPATWHVDVDPIDML